MAIGPSASLCWRVLNTRYFGVPQSRERIFIFADKQRRDAHEVLAINEVERGLHLGVEQSISEIRRSSIENDNGLVWSRRVRSNWVQRNHIGTVTAHESQDYHMLVERSDGAARQLTENEVEALMSWPKDHTSHPNVPWMQRYKILGNGVTPIVVAAIGKRIMNWREGMNIHCPLREHP